MKVTAIPLTAIISEPNRFNSSNHHPRPDDYHDMIARCDTRHWIGTFHPDHELITIPSREVPWLWQALSIGSMNRRVPKHYEDEIDQLAHTLSVASFPPGKPRFVRTDKTSLKTGVHKAGPYTTAKQVIESIVTCRIGHHPFDRTDESINLYILPWLEIDRDREFRVFVHSGRVTAISQQFIHEANVWLDAMDEEEIRRIAYQLTEFTERIVVPGLVSNNSSRADPPLESFVCDLVFDSRGAIRFIEINPFGAEYTSGSACFHWIDDDSVLMGRSEPEIRYVTGHTHTHTNREAAR